MSTMSDRLKAARIAAGFRSGSDAAAQFGWKTPTYLGHENGSRGFGPSKAREYAQAFGIDAAQLLLGGDLKPSSPPAPRLKKEEALAAHERAVTSGFDEERCRELMASAFVLLGLGSDEARNIASAITSDCHMPEGRSRSDGPHLAAAMLLKRFSSH